jgi:hypothetical protein
LVPISLSACSESPSPERESCNTRRAIADDQRRSGAGRKLAELCLCNGGDLRDGGGNIGAWLKKDLDDRNTIQRLRLNVLNVIDGCGHGPLKRSCDSITHLLRRESSVVPNDGDDRDVYIGEDISRRAENNNWTKN